MLTSLRISSTEAPANSKAMGNRGITVSKLRQEEISLRYPLVHAAKGSARTGAWSLEMHPKRCAKMPPTSLGVMAPWESICIHRSKSTDAVSSECRSDLLGVSPATRLRMSCRASRKGAGEGTSFAIFTLPRSTPFSTVLSQRYMTSNDRIAPVPLLPSISASRFTAITLDDRIIMLAFMLYNTGMIAPVSI